MYMLLCMYVHVHGTCTFSRRGACTACISRARGGREGRARSGGTLGAERARAPAQVAGREGALEEALGAWERVAVEGGLGAREAARDGRSVLGAARQPREAVEPLGERRGLDFVDEEVPVVIVGALLRPA
jgi:hypothetical protein